MKLYTGYAYKLDLETSQLRAHWRDYSDDVWDIVVIDDTSGKWLGTRRIDGAEVAVIETTDGIYASKNYGGAL